MTTESCSAEGKEMKFSEKVAKIVQDCTKFAREHEWNEYVSAPFTPLQISEVPKRRKISMNEDLLYKAILSYLEGMRLKFACVADIRDFDNLQKQYSLAKAMAKYIFEEWQKSFLGEEEGEKRYPPIRINGERVDLSLSEADAEKMRERYKDKILPKNSEGD